MTSLGFRGCRLLPYWANGRDSEGGGSLVSRGIWGLFTAARGKEGFVRTIQGSWI